MRVLLDENLPVDLAADIHGHDVDTVVGIGWSGVANGELLRQATGRFDAFVTMDRNLEYQQPLERQTFSIVLLRARSNRLADLMPLVPEILTALAELGPGEFRTIGA